MSKSKQYTCPKHRTRQSDWCPQCVADFEHRRHRDDMTGEERAAELDRLVHCVTIPMPDLKTRADELVGRSVFTHEIGFAFSALMDEARTNDHPSADEMFRSLPAGVPGVVVNVGDEEPVS